MPPPLDFGAIRSLEEQRQGLDQVGTRLFDGRALTGNVELGAKRYVSVIFPFDYGGEGGELVPSTQL